jgi:hypothetical protein
MTIDTRLPKEHAKGQQAYGQVDDASEGEGQQPHFVKNFTKSRIRLQSDFFAVYSRSAATGMRKNWSVRDCFLSSPPMQ